MTMMSQKVAEECRLAEIALRRAMFAEPGHTTAEPTPVTLTHHTVTFEAHLSSEEIARPAPAMRLAVLRSAGVRDACCLLACRLGFLSDTRGSGGEFALMRWRWDFWNGNRSWFAIWYVHRFGWAAYMRRFRSGCAH